MTNEKKWTPPFCARDANGDQLTCPRCKGGNVHVRDQERYCDGDSVEAYCGDCHAMLEVWADVDISFFDAELAYGESEDEPTPEAAP
jgi:Zn finger protein HypA/HybF involved in hydrogenase expression